jgi:hypothetical protein
MLSLKTQLFWQWQEPSRVTKAASCKKTATQATDHKKETLPFPHEEKLAMV